MNAKYSTPIKVDGLDGNFKPLTIRQLVEMTSLIRRKLVSEAGEGLVAEAQALIAGRITMFMATECSDYGKAAIIAENLDLLAEAAERMAGDKTKAAGYWLGKFDGVNLKPLKQLVMDSFGFPSKTSESEPSADPQPAVESTS